MRVASLVVVVLCALPAAAAAQGSEPEPVVRGQTRQPLDTVEVTSAELPSYWARGEPRYFFAGAFDVGALYARPRLSAGYGRPHHSWVGIDLNPIVSGAGVGAYSGLRLALPAVNLRVGGRYLISFNRAFLEPRDSYDHIDIQIQGAPRATYLSLESELTLSLPLGPGSLDTEIALTAVELVEDGYFVFEESIDVVVDPPWVWRTRLGYSLRFGTYREVGVGIVAEVVGVPARELYVLRAGFTASIRLWNHFELRGAVIPVIASRDRLGGDGGDTFILGFRYRWATGMD